MPTEGFGGVEEVKGKEMRIMDLVEVEWSSFLESGRYRLM
jgi:hypothetical protein